MLLFPMVSILLASQNCVPLPSALSQGLSSNVRTEAQLLTW